MNISLQKISVKLGEKQIFNDFCCKLNSGDFVLIKGANGSGKTTLGKVLAGEFFNYDGNYLIDGEKVTKQCELFGKTALVRANARDNFLFGVVKDEINFALKNMHIKRAERVQRVQQVSELCSIAHLLNKNTTDLSEGERQLVALASFLVFKPKLLVLDEALANVDVQKRRIIMTALKDMAVQQGHIFVYISNTKEDEKFFSKVIDLGGSEAQLFKIGCAQTNAAPVLELKNFCVKKQRQLILSNVNMQLAAGEAAVLCAPNASGKTSLANSMSGFYDYEGQYLIDGEAIKNKAQLFNDVGIVFAAAENFLCKDTPLDELKQVAGDEHAKQVAEALAIAPLLPRKTSELSTGEKRMVAVACAILKKPKVLIFDEALAGLSGEFKTCLLKMLQNLCAQGTAILLISHDGDDAAHIADRILHLETTPAPFKEKNITLGKSVPGKTLVHKTPAAIKLLIAFAFIFCVFYFSNWWVLLGLGCFALLILALACITPRMVFGYTRQLLVLTFALFALNWATISLHSGLLILARLSLVNIFVPVVSVTSSPLQILNVLSFPLLPFRWSKKAAGNFGAVCVLAVAALPEGSEFVKNIINFQRSLGIVYGGKKLHKKIVQRAVLLVPLLIFLRMQSLRKADVLLQKGFNFYMH